MRVGIRTKQVAGVMAIVGLSLTLLGGWYLASLTEILLESSRSRARIVANIIYQRTFTVYNASTGDPVAALRDDDGLRNILESYVFGENMLYASICDADNRVLVDMDPTRVDTMLTAVTSANNLDDLIDRQGPLARFRAIWQRDPGKFEFVMPLTPDPRQGSIRISVSTWLLKAELTQRLKTPLFGAAAVLIASIVVAIFLAQLVLRPIHVIRSGLARLGRGELDVNVELPPDAELADLGASFRQVTARLAADRSDREGKHAIESFVEQLEDAVALFGPDGALRFSNAAMDTALGLPAETPHDPPPDATVQSLLPADHPYRVTVEAALAGRPTDAAATAVPDAGQRLVTASLVPGADGAPLGVLLVSRNLAYISQVESTLSYSRKLSALNRLTAGIAHEIKNPLNATMIHLELLRMELADREQPLEHVNVIARQVRRLDEVVQGFLRFTRPEDLHLRAVDLGGVFDQIRPIVEAEAQKNRVEIAVNLPRGLPPIEGDATLLEQAFLNLALNACQAMPEGGRLTVSAQAEPARRISIDVEDTGTGIAPEHLSKIFDLYFTTKADGSGIGLSLVFRTVQLHNGEIEVQSTLGHGTRFRIHLNQAAHMLQAAGG
jgi:signal transduction histidine kinase